MRLRTGRKVGRTLYLQVGKEATDDDVLVGMMDSSELAAAVCAAVNHAGPTLLQAVVNSDVAPLHGCAGCGALVGQAHLTTCPRYRVPRETQVAPGVTLMGEWEKVEPVVHKRVEASRTGFVIPCDTGHRLADFTWTDDWDEVTCPACLRLSRRRQP